MGVVHTRGGTLGAVHTGSGAHWGVVRTGGGARWEWCRLRVVGAEGGRGESRGGEGGPGGSRWVELG